MAYDFNKELLRGVQTRLARLGYYRGGELDGEYGPLTSRAVIEFKKSQGLLARDLIGELTLSALFNPDAQARSTPQASEDTPSWMVEAISHNGLREGPGSSNNQTLLQWGLDLDQHYPEDSIPWCGLFVAKCMDVGAPDIPQNFNILGAREWLKFGEQSNAQWGAIAVFWRGSPNGWKGHVGFLVGEDSVAWHVLGGNQSDGVNVTRISKSRLLGFRVPPGYTNPRKLQSEVGGQLSINEA